MKNYLRTNFSGILGGFIGAGIMGAVFFTFSYVIAAPTQAPPNGNPSFPLQGPQGPQGNNGNNGSQGPQGPAGPAGPQGPAGGTSCTVCIRQCDWNGSGPCGSTCANEGAGWQSFQVQGAVDSNDQLSVRIDC